ncbi:MAG: hypothetical protein ACYC35_28055 [Pirellulales bacterium]
MAMEQSPDQLRDDKGLTAILADGHEAVMTLRNIKSSDRDITYIAEQAQGAFSDVVKRLEQINSLPKPPGEGELFASSFVDGFFLNFRGAYARGKDVEDKQMALKAEAEALLAAIQKADAARQLLPKVAEKYSASLCDSAERIGVDFDESWGCFGPHDWCFLDNRGPALQDCTIVVQLTGAKGDVRKNVHFVKEWPTNSRMYARYEGGQETTFRQTVYKVQQMDVTIYSPQFATLIKYVYEGPEKDKDVAARCKALQFKGRYQPFVSGIVWDTQRGVYFTLDGVDLIPQCQVEITFRRGSESKGWSWDYDYWKKGDEKWFGTSKEELTFEPDNIDITVSFPGTNYKHRATLAVK